jgi:nucleotide-binding universal stress UspA family protein
VKSVRDLVADFPFAVDAVAIADPVGVADGLEQHLTDVPARMLVLGGRHPEPLRPSGGIARHLLRNLTLPVLVVNQSD